MPPIKIYQIDAFSDRVFHGNPAAVCLLTLWIDASIMLSIAQENNLSETAFLVPRGNGHYEIRWFAPKGEVTLCGHGTLAAAFVVMNYLEPTREVVDFFTSSHHLRVEREEQRYRMRFPAFSFHEKEVSDCPVGLRCSGLEEVYEGNETWVLRFASESDVRAYQADFDYLKKNKIYLSITAPGETCDFVSRFFAPASGIDEDAVTGSVHCLLAPIWGKMLGKRRLSAIQVSERPGKLSLTLDGPHVFIEGQAACFMAGELYL